MEVISLLTGVVLRAVLSCRVWGNYPLVIWENQEDSKFLQNGRYSENLKCKVLHKTAT